MERSGSDGHQVEKAAEDAPPGDSSATTCSSFERSNGVPFVRVRRRRGSQRSGAHRPIAAVEFTPTTNGLTGWTQHRRDDRWPAPADIPHNRFARTVTDHNRSDGLAPPSGARRNEKGRRNCTSGRWETFSRRPRRANTSLRTVPDGSIALT